jgi:hypothetical protein
MVPSGNLTGCYWTLPIEIVDLPIIQMVIFPYLVSQRTHQVSSKRLDVRECIAKQCPDPRKPEDWSSVSLVPELDVYPLVNWQFAIEAMAQSK